MTIKKSVFKILALLMVVGISWTGFSTVGNTVSFFSDTEISANNIYAAGTLDFSIPSAPDFSPDITPAQNTLKTININNDGNLNFKYKVSAKDLNGDLCDYLNLEANLDGDGVECTDTALNSFDCGPFLFAAPEEWLFNATLSSGVPDSLQGAVCNFKLTFEGWQEDSSYGAGGFTDTEEVENTIKANYWNPPVVINEFLPNPKGEDNQTGLNGEWVELYNKTDNDIDVNNWYIKDSQGNIVPITSSNTMSNDTIVPSHGWSVVFMNGEILDNTSDTVGLYNNNDMQVDSYSYQAPEYNVNNTPGRTNNLSAYFPLDNDTNDKSGNGNNGINSGAVFNTGKINGGLSFDGNDNVTVNDSDSLKPNMITLEAWVKNVGSPGTYKYITGKHYNGSWASYALYTGSTGGARFYIGYAGGYVLSPSASATSVWNGEWHHIVGVFDGSKVWFYVDGVRVGDGTSTVQTIVYNNDDFYIGSYASGYYFDGMIDEVKVYGRALDDSEIQDHYSVVTFNGEVPENKSYARIPDGSINWVDPVPTPGEPNVLEEELTPLETEGETVSEIILTDTVCLVPEDNSVDQTEDNPEINVEETAPTEEVVSEEDNIVQENDTTNDTTIDAPENVGEEIQAPDDDAAQIQDVIEIPVEPEAIDNSADNDADIVTPSDDSQNVIESVDNSGDSGGDSNASSEATTGSSDSGSADSAGAVAE